MKCLWILAQTLAVSLCEKENERHRVTESFFVDFSVKKGPKLTFRHRECYQQGHVSRKGDMQEKHPALRTGKVSWEEENMGR